MNHWIALLLDKLAIGIPVVRMAVATVRGSAPREAGATLLFWIDEQGRTCSHGTIGGGRLEALALEIAGDLLNPVREHRRIERFSLGATLGQCCGGVVELYWERFDELKQADLLAKAMTDAEFHREGILRYCAMDGSGREWLIGQGHPGPGTLPPVNFDEQAGLLHQGEARYFVECLTDQRTVLWIFGAGHVGQALVHVLADLPFRITWVDSRPEMLDTTVQQTWSRHAMRIITAEAPEEVAVTAPASAWHLVMTHSHPQDMSICDALLRADRFGFLGLIGSRTKAARFRHRLTEKYGATAVARMTCPIGAGNIHSKLPAAIAVSIAAQLLQRREQADAKALLHDAHQPLLGVSCQ